MRYQFRIAPWNPFLYKGDETFDLEIKNGRNAKDDRQELPMKQNYWARPWTPVSSAKQSEWCLQFTKSRATVLMDMHTSPKKRNPGEHSKLLPWYFMPSLITNPGSV